MADGDVHDAGRRPRGQRRVQREPRVDGGGAAGRAVDGGRGPPDRRARPDGGARADRGPGARARSASSRRGSAWTGSSPSARSARSIADAGLREGVEPDNVAVLRRPRPGAGRRAAVGATRATWCCSRDRASPASNGWRRRCGEVDPGRRRVRARRHAARHADRDPGVPRMGLGSADPRGRPAHPHGEDGHAHDGRHRHRDRVCSRATSPRGSRSGTSRRPASRCCSPRSASAIVGFLDDFLKVRRDRSLGLSKLQKFVGHGDRVGRLRGRRRALLLGDGHVDRSCRSSATTGLNLGVLFYVWAFVDPHVVVARGEPHRRARRPGGRLVDLRALGVHVHRVLGVPPPCGLGPPAACYAIDADAALDTGDRRRRR